MLIPPDNFGMVEPGFYRCSKLEADHLPFLETLQLKSLVLLDVAKPPRTLKSFLSENHVDLYSLGGMKISNHQNTGNPDQEQTSKDESGSGTPSRDGHLPSRPNTIEVMSLERDKSNKNDSWMIIEKNLIVAAFEILLDRSKHDVLVVDSTSALVGILRKIQKWNFNSIVNEYRIYTGNASKISYNVEVFLELIQLELVPYELDHALRKRDESVDSEQKRRDSLSKLGGAFSRKLSASHAPMLQSPGITMLHPQAMRSQRSSIDDGNAIYEDDDTYSMGDYEEDLDDEFLSASPQIPANLLKLVEQRKNDEAKNTPNSPSTSPELRRPSLVSSVSCGLDISHHTAARHRRKSSVESRYIRANNNRFRDPQFNSALVSPSSPRRASIDASLRQYKIEQEKSSMGDIDRLRERLSHPYYQPMHAPANSFNVIKIRIPAEHNLAPWFVKARDFWDGLCKR